MRLVRATVSAAVGLFATTAMAQTLLFTEPGDAADDASGTSVAMVGDVDGDGAEDFAIGSPANDFAGSDAGMARVYSGRTRQPIHTWHAAAGDRFGQSVAGTGDLDGDGHADVVVGAAGGDYAEVFSGATGASMFHLVSLAGAFGHAVAGGADLDGDAVPDILVGAPQHNGGGSEGGALVVFSGATGASVRSHIGVCNWGWFGWSAAFYGDVDGDGLAEYAVGQPATYYACDRPKVFAYDGASGNVLWSRSSLAYSDEFGYSVAAFPDTNGDGTPDLIAGAPQDPGIGCACSGKGFVRLMDGATGNTIWQVQGVNTYQGLGSSLARVGDLDDNGFEDFAASQPGTEGCGGAAVQVRDGEFGALLVEIPPQVLGGGFGTALASGDANADGLRDLLVGTPCADLNGANSGATYAYTIVLDVETYCSPKVNSQGCTPTIYTTGLASFAASTLRVRALGVINNKSGLLFWGYTPAVIPFQGAYMCVKTPIVRTPVQSSAGNPPPNDCSGTYTFHFSTPYMTTNGIQAGDQIYCQYWSRDPADSWGTGLTAGLAFRVLP